MRTSVSLKQEFLRQWMKALQACSSVTKNNTSASERKNAIKLSADVAMASVRGGASFWSRALISRTVSSSENHQNNKNLITESILGRRHHHHKLIIPSRRLRCRRILKRSFGTRRRRVIKRSASKGSHGDNKNMMRAVAKRLVKKRTEVLRSLVPGGEFMEDEVSLIRETLDYVSYLQAQVDVMRCIATATDELVNR